MGRTLVLLPVCVTTVAPLCSAAGGGGGDGIDDAAAAG